MKDMSENAIKFFPLKNINSNYWNYPLNFKKSIESFLLRTIFIVSSKWELKLKTNIENLQYFINTVN